MAIHRTKLLILLLAAMQLSLQNPSDLNLTSSLDRHSTDSSSAWPVKTPLHRASKTTRSSSYSKTIQQTTSPSSTTSTTSTIAPSFAPYTTELASSGRTIYAKTGLGACNVEGTANTFLQSRVYFGSTKEKDILACQAGCRFTTACEGYSFDTSSSNCTFYDGDAAGNVDARLGTGIFFSNKYPADGSDFCYDDAVPPAGSAWLHPYPS